MSSSNKEKKYIKKKIGKTIKKVTFIVIKPFLPFIIVIGGIILAISTVSDAIFGNEEDATMVEKLSSEEYEAQYSEWLQYSNSGGTVIQNGAKLVPTGMFAWPLPDYMEITSGFGMRLHPVYNVDKMHTGIDVAAPIGADFVAMADGKVTFAKYTDGYGNMVMIDHGNGISTLYAHGSQILVNVGDEVTKGTPVLKVGSTGVSTGPHAHFEIRINGNFIDPQDYFEQEDIENDNNSETNTTNEEIKQDTEKQENVTEENGKEVDKYGPIIYG